MPLPDGGAPLTVRASMLRRGGAGAPPRRAGVWGGGGGEGPRRGGGGGGGAPPGAPPPPAVDSDGRQPSSCRRPRHRHPAPFLPAASSSSAQEVIRPYGGPRGPLTRWCDP